MSNGILIVDDHASIRDLLRLLVETKTPFKVCGEAENGVEAIKKGKELRPELVLLDLSLPDMSGTQAALNLQVQQPRPKIILFTIHTDGLNQEVASTYGIDVVLSKADRIGTIVDHITTLLSPEKRKQKPLTTPPKPSTLPRKSNAP